MAFMQLLYCNVEWTKYMGIIYIDIPGLFIVHVASINPTRVQCHGNLSPMRRTKFNVTVHVRYLIGVICPLLK